jgi:hypothetical protein
MSSKGPFEGGNEMNRGRGFGLLWLILTVLIAGVVGVVAYQAGVATHLPQVAPGATAPYYVFWPHFFGFGFGLIPLLLIVLLLFALFRRPWFYGPRGYGHHRDAPPGVEERFREWHERAHGGGAPAEPPSGPRTEA